MSFLEQFQQFIIWMILNHPIILFGGGAVLSWLAPTLLVWSFSWYRRNLLWSPQPTTQQRLLKIAGWARYAHYGVLMLISVLAIVLLAIIQLNLAKYSLQWTNADDVWFVAKVIGIAAASLVLFWWNLTCLIKGLEQIFRMWGSPKLQNSESH